MIEIWLKLEEKDDQECMWFGTDTLSHAFSQHSFCKKNLILSNRNSSCWFTTYGIKSFKLFLLQASYVLESLPLLEQWICKVEMVGPVSTAIQICSVSSLLCIMSFLIVQHFCSLLWPLLVGKNLVTKICIRNSHIPQCYSCPSQIKTVRFSS